MKIVIKIGGSILFNDDGIDLPLIEQWKKTIGELNQRNIKLGVVVGGGIYARKYISASKHLGSSASFQDLLGIEMARQNARLFISAFPNSYPHPPANYQELISVMSNHNLIFCGGFQPGQSTNAVAAIFAELLDADYLFNATKVDKVYSDDPVKNNEAIPYDLLDYEQFAQIIERNSQSPGKYALFDHIGLAIVRRSNIPLIFIDGKHPNYILDVVEGKERGTRVES